MTSSPSSWTVHFVVNIGSLIAYCIVKAKKERRQREGTRQRCDRGHSARDSATLSYQTDRTVSKALNRSRKACGVLYRFPVFVCRGHTHVPETLCVHTVETLNFHVCPSTPDQLSMTEKQGMGGGCLNLPATPPSPPYPHHSTSDHPTCE